MNRVTGQAGTDRPTTDESVPLKNYTERHFRSGQKVSNLSQLQLNVTQKNTVVTTERGDQLTTDLIICCTGGRVNATAYRSSF
ncbi:hypothetical protein EPR50_G00182860 [Perca flavescens]|uniref:FAD/NAD(P)-binding domain-containing protein n=1 Tax=Perca flavescens TaxID=8167 RepID=A0A484CII1_PERFV|nr:hypothetical protein EPR50_G00182860 [Perca flavescens]